MKKVILYNRMLYNIQYGEYPNNITLLCWFCVASENKDSQIHSFSSSRRLISNLGPMAQCVALSARMKNLYCYAMQNIKLFTKYFGCEYAVIDFERSTVYYYYTHRSRSLCRQFTLKVDLSLQTWNLIFIQLLLVLSSIISLQWAT